MSKGGTLEFIRSQFTALPEVDKIDLTGRNVIVTGSNVGLGKEAARHFAAMSPDLLILAVRNLEAGQAAVDDIKSTTGTKSKVEVWKLDLGDFKSVTAFADKVEKELPRLDVLLENAGIATDKWSMTANGYERTLQINDISTAWLGLRLLPLLQKTAKLPAPSASKNLKPHLTLTGSEVHFWAKFQGHDSEKPLAYLNDEKTFDKADRYYVSKLLNIFIAREIGKVSGDVNVNVVNPGLCHSELGRDSGMGLTVMKFFLARSTEAGSRTLVWACLNDTPKGAYSSNCRVQEESDFALSAEGKAAQKKVWQEIVSIIAAKDSKAAKVAGV